MTKGQWPLSLADWSPPPFPLHAFPAPVAAIAKAIAQGKQCPADFAALPMLAAACAAIGASRGLEIVPGWHELPCLYAALVAPPGSRKTPAMRAALSPAYARQQASAAQHEAGLCEEMEHVWVQDCTVEGMVQVLKKQAKGVLLVQDELVAWVLGDNKYRSGKGADRQFWLSAWSSEPVKTDRKGSGSTHIRAPFLCALGGIQPDMLPSLMDGRGREDGFVHRILFSYPDPGMPLLWGQGREGTGDGSLRKALSDWAALMERLYALEQEEHDDGIARPILLPFSAKAMKRWAAFYDRHVMAPYAPGFPLRMQGPWSKLLAYAARFALALCVMRDPESTAWEGAEVEPRDMDGAEELVAYFAAHAWGTQLAMRKGEHDALLPGLASLAEKGPVPLKRAMRAMGLLKSQALALFKRAEDLGMGDTVRKAATPGARAQEQYEAETGIPVTE